MVTYGIVDSKLIEAVIYLSERSQDDPHFGMTKLVKLLYFADCAAYHANGAPITEAEYLHFPHGPYPNQWYQVRRKMEKDGDVTIAYEQPIQGYHRYRMIPNRSANMEMLSSDDQKLLDEQVKRFAQFNAAAIEAYSHQESGWLSTEDGEPISYKMSGFIAPPPTIRSVAEGLGISR
jgi:uncharacterized phage-associated protein